MTKTVYVIYYSTYGHVKTMAHEVVKGLEKSGVKAKLFQVPEILSKEILDKMHAPPKASDVPIITPAQLTEADGKIFKLKFISFYRFPLLTGFIFGLPTRFGSIPAQMKAFFDACGQLWMAGAL